MRAEEAQDLDRLLEEAAGIAVSDGSGVVVYKDLGLVSQVFDEPTLASLRGHLESENGDEASGSSSYIPPEKENDKQLQAAIDLYGANSNVERAVTEAWTAVGVWLLRPER